MSLFHKKKTTDILKETPPEEHSIEAKFGFTLILRDMYIYIRQEKMAPSHQKKKDKKSHNASW